jgi:hypothetical protein
MVDIQKVVFPDEGKPDHAVGLICGIVGGLAGAYAMHLYWKRVAPKLFPLDAQPVETPGTNTLPSPSPLGQQYRPGETATMAAGRIAYQQLTGYEPRDLETRRLLSDLVYWGWGVAMGAAYGGTRNTTRWRDLAGGFFYGFRLFLGDLLMPPLAGLRADPRYFSPKQHLWRLSAIWVYSFTTTAVTRALYRLVPPELRTDTLPPE